MSKPSFLQECKNLFQYFSNEGTYSTNNLCIKPLLKKNQELLLYKDDKEEKESEKSMELAKNLFLNLKNDLVNVYEDKNANNSSQNNNSSDFSATKTTANRDIPSEKKTTNIKVFTTHSRQNQENEINKKMISLNEEDESKKKNIEYGLKKKNLTIKVEKIDNEHLNSHITANKVRESKECHNITQLNNESSKNINRKRFLFREFESQINQSLNETKIFPNTTKNQNFNEKTNLNFFKMKKNNEKLKANQNLKKDNNIKHERIKSLDLNSFNNFLSREDGDEGGLLKKLDLQKNDIKKNNHVIFSIKEILDKQPKKDFEKGKSKKKVLDADIDYFKK